MQHRNRFSKIHVLWLALVAPLLALLALGACNAFDAIGNYDCKTNPSWCHATPPLDAGPPRCCTAPTTPFSCRQVFSEPEPLGQCPYTIGICALNDGDAIGQLEITAHNNGLTLAQPIVCVPSFCGVKGPQPRRPPRHPLDTDAGPIEVEGFDGGALSCEDLMADAGVCAANTDTCSSDNDCCSGVCSEANACEACRAMLEGCTSDSDCCSGICSLNACGGNAPGTGGGSP